jgi:cysteine synthase
VLAQFELLPNYRFHRFVTGQSALEMASRYGNKRVAAFVSAPGSAGTIAAGDEIKAKFADAVISALEPSECSTLFNNGRGTHRIEGIGDKMVTLIHNVLTTDYVQLIHDDDCVAGLELVQQRSSALESMLGVKRGALASFAGTFGVSSICNILGAIRLAKHLNLGKDDNVVTIATDGFDRYPSVIADLEQRRPMKADAEIKSRFEAIYRGGLADDVLDVRPRAQKERLFQYKEDVWTKFGYTRDYLEKMKQQSFWDAEYDKVRPNDEKLARERKLA